MVLYYASMLLTLCRVCSCCVVCVLVVLCVFLSCHVCSCCVAVLFVLCVCSCRVCVLVVCVCVFLSYVCSRRVSFSKPLMDLLVMLCAQYHLSPSSHTLELVTANRKHIKFKPNARIGALDAHRVLLRPKGGEDKNKKASPQMPEVQNTCSTYLPIPNLPKEL